MSNVFKTNEVYKHLKHGFKPQETITPVRGVYVSGEYRPPYYNDGVVAITNYQTTPAIAASFKSEYTELEPIETLGLYKIDVSTPDLHLQRYMREFKELEPIQTLGLYKLYMTDPHLYASRYERDYDNSYDLNILGMYQVDISDPTFHLTRYYKDYGNSTPEPILRITGFTTAACTVENYSP